MTRTSGITLQILGVAIFASSMFFFAMAVSRASSIDHGQQGPNNDKMQSEWPTAAETTDDSDYPLSLWALMQFATHGWQAAQGWQTLILTTAHRPITWSRQIINALNTLKPERISRSSVVNRPLAE
jgi:hypothetical protein